MKKADIISFIIVVVIYTILAIILLSTLKNKTSAHEAETVLYEVKDVYATDEGFTVSYYCNGKLAVKNFKTEDVYSYDGESEIVALYPKGGSRDKPLKMYLYLSMDDYHVYAQEITQKKGKLYGF